MGYTFLRMQLSISNPKSLPKLIVGRYMVSQPVSLIVKRSRKSKYVATAFWYETGLAQQRGVNCGKLR